MPTEEIIKAINSLELKAVYYQSIINKSKSNDEMLCRVKAVLYKLKEISLELNELKTKEVNTSKN